MRGNHFWLPEVIISRLQVIVLLVVTFATAAYCCDVTLHLQQQPICVCPASPCLRKCCPLGEAMVRTKGTRKCTPVQVEFANSSSAFRSYWKFQKLPEEATLTYGKFCPSRRVPESDFEILPTGNLRADTDEYGVEKYCVELFAEDHRIDALVCLEEDMPQVNFHENTVITMYPIAMGISDFFLIFTFVVYAIVDELRNLHGKTLQSHIIALFVTYTSSALLHLTLITNEQRVSCILLAIVVQFSFLASFFWLNVMCFDLWWTFSGYRSFNGSVKERERKKFIAYSVYAWGFPSLITGVTLLVEFLPGIPKWVIKPDFGQTSCWFNEKKSVLIYFYGPISALLLSNLLMFIHTTVIIVRHKRESKVLKRQGSRKHSTSDTDKQRFFVYLKLFIVMGVNWIMEVVSWLAEGPQYLWYLPDIGNALQGVLIFVIFVCKRRVLRLLNKKLCPGIQIFKDESKATSSRSTSVSSLGSTKRGSKNVGGGRVQMSVFSGGNLPASNTVNGNKGDFMA